jgi:hypothetical protein
VLTTTSVVPEPSTRAAAEPARAAVPRDRRQRVVGVVLAALLSFGLMAFLAVRLPPFFGADERAHFSYTVTLLDGRLPEFTEPQPFTDRYPIIERSLDPPGPEAPRQQAIFVALHPPLTYAVAAPAVWVAGLTPSDALPTLAFRLVNAASMAVGVALAGFFAAELFPGRRGVAVAAALLTAVVPNLLAVGAYAHNDGPAFALTTACLLVSARLLQRGLSPGRLVAGSLLAAAAMSTRASAAVAVAAVVASAVVAAWRSGPGLRAAAVRAVGAGLAVGTTAIVAAGWFYVRNQRLYGTPTGDEFAFDALGRQPVATLPEAMTTSAYHSRMWTGLYGTVHPFLPRGNPGWVLAGLALVIVTGLLLALTRRLRAPASGEDDAGRGGGIGLAGWAILAGFCGAVVLSAARHYASGGGPHPRYLLALVPVVSALLARALAELPWPRLALALVAGTLLAVTSWQVAQFPDLIGDPARPRPFDQATAGAWAQAAALSVAVAAGVGVVALLVSDWWGRRRMPDPARAGG